MENKQTLYRNLTVSEVEQLKASGNYSCDWAAIRVAEPFNIRDVRSNTFDGEVTIGGRATIVNSALRNVTLGEDTVVRDVRLLSGYAIGAGSELFNIGEMSCDGKAGKVEVMNENGGRWIRPFAGMTTGDAYMWARFRGRKAFIQRLEEYTDKMLASSEGGRGQVGVCCTVKGVQTIRNVSIMSRMDDPTVIDGAIALCDGVVGRGCKVGHGVIAERFLLGEHVTLEFGLRLNDSVVGDNSTLARCEVGNSMIFPAHEQHHNNSFLIAALVMGQSNVAAGGTIGSNHNSRTADNELAAGRGFWPGLCCSFKHSSRFASYCLLAKGDYPSELDIKLPFALVNNNVAKDRLEVMPAYWWMYNMYAMDRNSRKFALRDKRVDPAQNVEFASLAPDTAEEILVAMELLNGWIAAADGGTVYGEGMEKSKRPTVILKAREGLKAYEDMLVLYAVSNLTPSPSPSGEGSGMQLLPQVPTPLSCGRGVRGEAVWLNIGGQLVAGPDMEQLIADVESGELAGWRMINDRLDTLWRDRYPQQRLAHAYGVLCRLAGTTSLDEATWKQYLERYEGILKYIEEQKVASRQKDEENPFRNMTYWDDAERVAVLGR